MTAVVLIHKTTPTHTHTHMLGARMLTLHINVISSLGIASMQMHINVWLCVWVMGKLRKLYLIINLIHFRTGSCQCQFHSKSELHCIHNSTQLPSFFNIVVLQCRQYIFTVHTNTSCQSNSRFTLVSNEMSQHKTRFICTKIEVSNEVSNHDSQ